MHKNMIKAAIRIKMPPTTPPTIGPVFVEEPEPEGMVVVVVGSIQVDIVVGMKVEVVNGALVTNTVVAIIRVCPSLMVV